MANDTTPEPQAESEARVYDDLTALVRAEATKLIEGKERAYRVVVGGGIRYAVANSPGNAALAVAAVDLVPPKQVRDAALAAIAAKGEQLSATDS